MKKILLISLFTYSTFVSFGKGHKDVSQFIEWELKKSSKAVLAKYLHSQEGIGFFENQQGKVFLLPLNELTENAQFAIQLHDKKSNNPLILSSKLLLEAPKVWLIMASLLVILIGYKTLFKRK